ncbi:CoxG family protein [Pusillimonas noertemannii]|uniref:Carbon monoxide dehydrogenase subunit G n=1 Tax=Pusillimonas noertemannii TaxID=305977 RepID=A0A2U1CP62_9BURK|nr:carbon monoxide dehydrogenase subunit G [Pusillimonas noertemannii]NYT67009.1 carbon monoxide dehydrogenase subunit G [Pusillimonas noertemannii]PVY67682.1 hypothetical protein C7440_0065 [Pusillimonas noertemannii]TFL12780.1 carbon monoxide dehydrogenase [Pusillimonas noertemannii]
MQLTNEQTLSAPLQQVWDALNDTAILQACIPGCETLTLVEANRYELQILAAIGPVKARFKGKLQLSDLQPPKSYTIQFEGQGGAAGHGKGAATVLLKPQDPDTTILHYTATATVGGKIAQIGQRLVDMAAQRMAAEFFSNFEKALQPVGEPLQSVQASPPAANEAKPSLPARFRQWWLRLFRKKK